MNISNNNENPNNTKIEHFANYPLLTEEVEEVIEEASLLKTETEQLIFSLLTLFLLIGRLVAKVRQRVVGAPANRKWVLRRDENNALIKFDPEFEAPSDIGFPGIFCRFALLVFFQHKRKETRLKK